MSKRKDRIEVFSVIRDESSVRGILALVFIGMFAFFLFSSIILGGASLVFKLEDGVAQSKEIIVTISSIFSGPLGLVIGYYFRTQTEKDNSGQIGK